MTTLQMPQDTTTDNLLKTIACELFSDDSDELYTLYKYTYNEKEDDYDTKHILSEKRLTTITTCTKNIDADDLYLYYVIDEEAEETTRLDEFLEYLELYV